RDSKPENPWLNLAFNLVIPAVLLSKGQKWFDLSPATALCVGLLFPVGYGAYDLIVRKKYNALSILGFVSLLLTGGIGLLELPTEWVAWKEAAIPAIIAIAVVASLKTRYPLVKTFLYRDEVLQTERIEKQLRNDEDHKTLERLLQKATYALCASFALSAVLNFMLAKWIVHSPAGTAEFTEQIGRMTAWSYPVIVLPSAAVLILALWQLIRGLQKLTGLPMDELLANAKK
ncbi:MAG: hypothetical protein B7X06_00285, partial [Verrucomicrobia bacterium 21-51-4]